MKYTKKIYVGEDYKIPFWIKKLRRCKLDSGYFYFKNEKLIEKLKLDGNKVEEVYLDKIEKIDNECRRLKEKNSSLKKQIFSLEEKLENLIKNQDLRIKRILTINKEFLLTLNDFEKEKKEEKEEGIYRRKLEEKKLEEKLKEFNIIIDSLKINEKNLEDKLDGLLDIISDEMAKNIPFPNLLSSNFTLSKISNMKTDNLTKALYSIIYIMKKNFSERGMSIR